MRSGEFARLAGVTVRALRHYHQVGVLAEPERGVNGYRSYDVHDLVRVLRIRRLASIGVPLERMPALLDDTDTDTDSNALLDELDAELGAQIDRLTRQRALVAQVRALGTAPDLPPELAPYLAAFTSAGGSAEQARLDRDVAVLLGHVAGEQGLTQMARFYEQLSAPERAPEVAALTDRFLRLDDDSTDEEVERVVADSVAAVGPLLREFEQDEPWSDLESSGGMVSEHAASSMNARQRHALQLLIARLDG